MNRFILFIFFLLSSLSALEFQSYDEALKHQLQNGKIIMLNVMRADCHYCMKMEEESFEDKNFSLWIEKHFIPVEINLDFDELPLGINVFVTPSFFFIDSSHKLVKKIAGYWNQKDFKNLIKNIK